MTIETMSLAKIEELMVTAADGDRNALTQLINALKAIPAFDQESSKLLKENLEMVITDPQAAAQDEQLSELAIILAHRGLDLMLVRDVLAALSRDRYSDYPDPAGMISAMGVLDQRVDIIPVTERFEMFGLLKEGNLAWHDSYGFGKIVSIDALTNVITIAFSTKQDFGLKQALENLNFVAPDSSVAAFLDGSGSFDRATTPDDFDREASQCFRPHLVSPRLVVEKLLVPKHIGPREFISWRDQKSADKANKTATSETEATVSTANIEITWENARGIQELRVHLDKVKKIKLTEEHLPNLQKVFAHAAGNARNNDNFAYTLALLWKLAPGHAVLRQLIAELPEDAAVWQDVAAFVTATCSLKAKMVEKWLHITLLARGLEWFLACCTDLPLKHWTQFNDILAQNDIDPNILAAAVMERIRKREARPDAVVWLWRQERDDSAELLSNPRLILESMAFQAKGEFIRARKMIHEMLMSNEKFQTAMMDGGTDEGIDSFVKTVKTTNALDLSDQKVLLVKICRLFPQAKKYVEDRRRGAEVQEKKLPKQSSFRSLDERRAELKAIINKKIPENSAAIAQARSYGDLRENFEFKAAKEQQRLLMARRDELESDLIQVRPTDFSEVVADKIVVPGLTAEVEVNGELERYHILGLWDSDPDRNILSYETPVGKALIGHEVGESVNLPRGDEATIVAVYELPDEIKQWLGTAE